MSHSLIDAMASKRWIQYQLLESLSGGPFKVQLVGRLHQVTFHHDRIVCQDDMVLRSTPNGWGILIGGDSYVIEGSLEQIKHALSPCGRLILTAQDMFGREYSTVFFPEDDRGQTEAINGCDVCLIDLKTEYTQAAIRERSLLP